MMAKRQALGKGLGALLPTGLEDEADRGVQLVPVEAIRPNPHQPRTDFGQAALQELADSIVAHGLIQPLIVTEEEPGQFTLIAGERRWRASRLAGLAEVPVMVKEVTPQARMEMALIENIQRADLNPIEEAMAYQQLIAGFQLTQQEVAQRVGKSRSELTNRLRLLELPAGVQQAVSDGRLSYGHARALVSLPSPEAQINLMKVIVDKGLSVRQAEAIAQKIKQGEKPRPKAAPPRAPEVAALESRFRDSLGTRVTVQRNRKGAGKIVIHFYSDEELQALYEAIVGRA